VRLSATGSDFIAVSDSLRHVRFLALKQAVNIELQHSTFDRTSLVLKTENIGSEVSIEMHQMEEASTDILSKYFALALKY
jgi:hypothetical protein